MPNHASGRSVDMRASVVQAILREADKLLKKLDQNDLGEAAAIMSLAVDAIAKQGSRTVIQIH